MASCMCKILRLSEEPSESDPLKRELCLRLLSTVVLMDRTLSPSLNVPCYFSPDEVVPQPCDDEELARIKTRVPRVARESSANLITELLRLSQDFRQICLHHRQGGNTEGWQEMERRHSEWPSILHGSLAYNRTNIESHRAKHTLRRFTYMHLMHHHIGQLIYFPFLQANASTSGPAVDMGGLQVLKCRHQARQITEIIQNSWVTEGFDVHNVSIGQILTVAAAVIMHARLTSSNQEQGAASQTQLVIINDSLTRIKAHCRIFDRIVRFFVLDHGNSLNYSNKAAQLDTFLRICSQSTSSKSIFKKNERLIRHILHYGSAYERLNYGDAGMIPSPSQISVF
jgi:hypothetical protein